MKNTNRIIKETITKVLNSKLNKQMVGCDKLTYQPDRQAVLNWQSEKNKE